MKKRVHKDKYAVYGEYGDTFSNMDDAKKCAKFASTTPEYNYSCCIWLLSDGCNYIDYENGKMVRDGWTRKKH